MNMWLTVLLCLIALGLVGFVGMCVEIIATTRNNAWRRARKERRR